MKINFTCEHCGKVGFSGYELEGNYNIEDCKVGCRKCGKYTTLNIKSDDMQIDDEGSFNWKTAGLYYGIILLEVLLVVAVVWLLVKVI